MLGSSNPDVADAGFDAYHQARGVLDRELDRRAAFAAELKLANWLLHGTGRRSTEIVDDAVEMLHALLNRVSGDLLNPLAGEQPERVGLDEVQELLDRDRRDQLISSVPQRWLLVGNSLCTLK